MKHTDDSETNARAHAANAAQAEYFRHELGALRKECRAKLAQRYIELQQVTAAESEVRRLDILVATLVDALRKHDTIGAGIYERKHNEERISADTVRPIVDRPLAPWELPVREVPVRRGRWW